MKKPPPPIAGVFRPEELYTLKEVRQRAGMGDTAIRQARKRGLTVYVIGNARFVYGKDFIEFVLKHGESERP